MNQKNLIEDKSPNGTKCSIRFGKNTKNWAINL